MPAPPPSYRRPAVVERDLGEVVDALAARLVASRAPSADEMDDAPEVEQEVEQPAPVDEEGAGLPASLRVAWHPRGFPSSLASSTSVGAPALRRRRRSWPLRRRRAGAYVVGVVALILSPLVLTVLVVWFR